MNWFLGTIILLVLMFLVRNHYVKKSYSLLRQRLLTNWGKPKEGEYFSFYVITKYFDFYKNDKDAYHVISDPTANDIDFNDLFKFIDRTISKIGQQFLYYKLRVISDVNDALKLNQLSSLFIKDEKLRLECQLALTKLSANNSYDLVDLISGDSVKKAKFLWVAYVLTFCSILLIGLGFYNPLFFFLIIPIYTVNIFLHFRNKQHVDYYLNGIVQLSKAQKVAEELINHDALRKKYITRPFLNNIEAIKLRTEFISLDRHITNEYLLAIWLLIESVKILFNIEYLVFNSFVDAVNKEKQSIEALFVFIGEVDTALTIASLQSGELETCTPEFNKNNVFVTEELVHPLIENCIPNTMQLLGKSMLLTGANMSGKTTFIRSVAINSILAQSLNLCFAKSYKAPFFKLYSSIRIADDLSEETSYYLEEVLRLSTLIKASKEKAPCLFVIDEVFKGTNTIERISGAKGVLSYLNRGNNMVMVSTHDVELTDILAKDNYDLFHFSEKVDNNKLIFDRKLKEGRLKTRNAIKILELYDYPEEIIAAALAVEKVL